MPPPCFFVIFSLFHKRFSLFLKEKKVLALEGFEPNPQGVSPPSVLG